VVDGSAIQINHSGYAENREQRTENREQRTENREQRTENNSGPTAPPKSHFPNPKKTRHNQNLREKEILTLEETLILKQLSGFVKSAQSNQSCVFGYTNMVTNLQALRYLIGQNSNGARLRFRSWGRRFWVTQKVVIYSENYKNYRALNGPRQTKHLENRKKKEWLSPKSTIWLAPKVKTSGAKIRQKELNLRFINKLKIAYVCNVKRKWPLTDHGKWRWIELL